jgi:hypothetical protein
MSFLKTIAAVAALSIAAVSYSAPAEANANDAIIAGAAGFAVGTLFGNATARPRYVAPRYVAPQPVYYYGHPRYRQWVAYCSAKYRSFDPRSGLYLGYDGQYHPCRF